MAVPVLLFKKSHLIPYGPFLSLAALVCILMQDYFIGLINVYVQLFCRIIFWISFMIIPNVKIPNSYVVKICLP